MKPLKILLNYDYKLYPFTTASYFELTMRDEVEYLPYRKCEIDPAECDFIINFETCHGVITAQGIPSAYYEIDNHLIAGRELYNYNPVDVVFIAQEVNKEHYPPGKTHVLSLAAYPKYHKPFPKIEEIYDVGFLGNDTYPIRKAHLDAIGKRFKLLRKTSEPGIPYSKLLSQCRILFNCSMNQDVNMRFFESMAIGKPFVTDYLPEQDSFATAGAHYFAYHDMDEMLKIIKMLLKNKKKRRAYGECGRRNIILNHTYSHRIKEMLKVMRKYDKV